MVLYSLNYIKLDMAPQIAAWQSKTKQGSLCPRRRCRHLFPQHLKSHSLSPAVLGPCQRHEWGSCRCRHTEEHKHRLAFTTSGSYT